MTTIIYGLKDPETQELRYVGQTRRSLDLRLKSHLMEKGTYHKANWIKNLKKRGLVPEIFDIDSVADECADDTEQLWIAWHRIIGGANLTNGTEGGKGYKGGKHSAESRAQRSAATRGEKNPFYGKKHSSETRAKISAAELGEKNYNYGKKLSGEQRDKISAAHKGKKRPPRTASHRAKLSEAMRGKKHSPDTRAKISAARRGNKNLNDNKQMNLWEQ